MIIDSINQKFVQVFGHQKSMAFCSPGRINLIGEHTDYNGGFVVPGAIDKNIAVRIAQNNTNEINVYSINYDAAVNFILREDDLPESIWAKYVFGVCMEMKKAGVAVRGFNAVFFGDIPLGSGLSSSAAMNCVFAFALNQLFEGNLSKMELAKIGQQAEHNYGGVQCGIMDQFASLFGKKLINSANKIYFAFASAIVFYTSYCLLADCMEIPDWISLTVFFIVAAVAELAAFLQRNEKEDDTSLFFKHFWIIGWFAIAEIGTYISYRDFFNTGALFVALLPIAVYGAKKEYTLFRNQAIILAALMTLLELFGERSLIFCAVELVYAVIILTMEGFVVNKALELKFIWYFYVQVCIAIFFCTVAGKVAFDTDDYMVMFAVIPVGLFNVLMRVLKFYRDDQGQNNMLALMALDIVNALGILVGLYNIIMIDGAIPQGINIAFTTALASVNVRRHFAGTKNEKLYTGIKFGIILLFSLISYDSAGYIVSVATLAFAILCISVGFNKNFGAKELLVYGLILSMFCVVKFIMIDITYENTIGRAISFLISGILCFGISAIYNHFEKQGQE